MAPTVLAAVAVLAWLCCTASAAKPARSPSDLPSVHWMAPILSGGGYSSEAIAFLMALSDAGLKVSSEQHGDSYNWKFVENMPENVRERLQAMVKPLPVGRGARDAPTVAICHAEPGAWHPSRYPTSRCPPYGASYSIGRTMFETDRLPAGWEDRCNTLDEVWVPTEFHRRIFETAGVRSEKLFVLPEPVDTDLFTPDATPLDLATLTYAAGRTPSDLVHCKTKLLSIFKWERRKGYDILLESFLSEFSDASGLADDGVCLFIRAASYHGDVTFEAEVSATSKRLRLPSSEEGGASGRIFLIQDELSWVDLPRLYKAVDAFVLPSRGEGWGRPHVEAMATGLPIVATNWSGTTAYMTEFNSFPLRYDGLEEIQEGAFKGHKWASPSVSHLRELLRQIVSDPEEAKRRGAVAREDMVERFRPTVLAQLVQDRLEDAVPRIERKRQVELKDKAEL